MNKGFIQLVVGLLLSLTALLGDGGLFIPWELQLLGGVGLMLYGSYRVQLDFEKTRALKNIVAVWGIFLLVGSYSMLSNSDSQSIRENDLKDASNFEDIKTCEEGTIKAKEDLEKGIYRRIVGSYASRQGYVKVLSEEYNIDIIEVDGVLGIPNSCYNDVMHKALQEKYGPLYLNKIMERD